MSEGPTQLSIIVPTYREADNVALLIERVFGALSSAGITAEMILVDDNSQDGSLERVQALGKDYPVQMIVRRSERGLSTAVLHGFEHAKGDIFLVMDADLSHPPDRVADLYAAIESGEADFVFGSRYASGGETKDWPFVRKLNSWAATLLARPLTSATDPMAGFFCLHRRTWEQAAPLNPLGYKIGLELLIKGRCSRLKDVPIIFADRHAGKSKLTFTQQLLYLVHLKRLYFFKRPLLSMLIFYFPPVVVLGCLLWWWLK